ncbi:aminopeptidase N [Afifella sp. IM 167]|uniref:aminopeptidase N n=1 Tax=Afifella sp. IM 167 TaxID=2033586 RepID=UPI001CCDD6A1|nr:aminopeptidase N [Afifella sp. IM 167]MBZ8133933.1 aminopeptidase N [Afifella sp. IM 167]
MQKEAAALVRLEEYRPTDYAIDTVALDFSLAPTATRVTARLELRRRAEDGPPPALVLDGDGLKLVSISLDGRRLSAEEYEASPDRLTITNPPSSPFRLETVTEIDPDNNTALMGLYRSSGVYTTQCEAEGFRRITYFYDRPDVLSVYTVRIEAPAAEAPVLLSNGNLTESGPLAGTGRHYAVWHDPFPKPSYLFALVAGDLGAIHDIFVTASGRRVRLAIYCEHGKEERCRYAMDALKRSMRWDEEVFGREYDLDVFNIVAVSDFNMGAMENKGLNVFNDKYVLVDPETGTDSDYAHVEGVIAHEYFHNWTGNRITCRDWFQLCLKEGLTVFRDEEFSADMRSRPVKRIADVIGLRQAQFPEDAGPLAHPVRPTAYREINNFYTATVYIKGAEICRMLKTLLGEEGFRAGMDLYFERHDGGAVTIEDFVECFAEATGEDLSQFSLWYHQAGTPKVTMRHRFDEAAGTLSLSLKQELPETPDKKPKKPMLLPLAFGLVGPDGQDLSFTSTEGAEDLADAGKALERGLILLGADAAELTFTGLKARAVPSVLRGFSAPIQLEGDLSADDLFFLARQDGDPFNRWEALQGLARRAIAEGYRARRAGDVPRFDPRLAAAFGELAENEAFDPAFRALALALPSEGEMAQILASDVDPDALHDARDALAAEIGRISGARIEAASRRAMPEAVYSPDAENAGRRAFAHAAWRYRVAAGEDGAFLTEAFAKAENLTVRSAALAVLVHARLAGAEEALAAFYERYRDNPLVLDKWFSVQATRPGHDTLEVVAALTESPAFSWKTPNRVYSLVRAFGGANLTAFHRPDGAGYRFLADAIVKLDGQNPSVASRLATCFRSYRLFEAERREKAEAVLKSLAGRDNLSRDVSDILTRTLA